METFERVALGHIAQELLWDTGLIPLASFNARQRARIVLMLERLAKEGAGEMEVKARAAGRRR
jgi:hypothetical protein